MLPISVLKICTLAGRKVSQFSAPYIGVYRQSAIFELPRRSSRLDEICQCIRRVHVDQIHEKISLTQFYSEKWDPYM